jgi:hypothetical protein
MWRLACQSCDQMEGLLLFKWGLRCDFNGRVNGRNIVNEPNRPLALPLSHSGREPSHNVPPSTLHQRPRG